MLEKIEILNRKRYLNINANIIIESDLIQDVYEYQTFLDAMLIDIEIENGYFNNIYDPELLILTYFEEKYLKIRKIIEDN